MIEKTTVYYINEEGHIRDIPIDFWWTKHQWGHWHGSLRIRDDNGSLLWSGPHCMARPRSKTIPISDRVGPHYSWRYSIMTGPNTGDKLGEGFCETFDDVRQEAHPKMLHYMIHHYDAMESVWKHINKLMVENKRLRQQIASFTKPQGKGEFLCIACNHMVDEVYATEVDLCVGCHVAVTDEVHPEYHPIA